MTHRIGRLALVAFAVVGCDSRPLPGSPEVIAAPPLPQRPDDNSTPPTDNSTPPTGCVTNPDAAPLAGECSDLVPCGPDVRFVFKAGPPPDLGQGGTITDGTYDVIELTIYQSGPTDNVFTDRETLRISGGGTRLDYVTGSNGATILESIAPAGASLNPTTLCPGPGAGVSVGPYYTATADTFTVVNGLYTKVFALRR